MAWAPKVVAELTALGPEIEHGEMKAKATAIIPLERIQEVILEVRGQRAIVDTDLARLYGVPTARLNQQVKRNHRRFPRDFTFQLTDKELRNLMLHNATSSFGWGGRRKPPFAFTEFGAIMAANVLNSEQAVRVSVLVVRAFVKMRELAGAHAQLAEKINELEKRLDTHDDAILNILETIRLLMEPPAAKEPRKQIGFEAERDSN